MWEAFVDFISDHPLWDHILTVASSIIAIGGAIGLFPTLVRTFRQANKPHLNLTVSKLDSLPAVHGRQPGAPRSQFFHLVVTNRASHSVTANNARVMLQRVIALIDGREQDVLGFPIQVAWTPSEEPVEGKALHPGHRAIADALQVTPEFVGVRPRRGERVPNNLADLQLPRSPVKLKYRVISDEASSNSLWLRFDWNGEWSPSKRDTARNLLLERSRIGFLWFRIMAGDNERIPRIVRLRRNQHDNAQR